MHIMVSPTPLSVTTVDGKIWQTFQMNFSQVQNILDQNRVLIEEINQNHESKVPESLTRNVPLIRELNNNIIKVVDLYASLSGTLTEDLTSDGEEVFKIDAAAMQSPVSAGQKRLRVS